MQEDSAYRQALAEANETTRLWKERYQKLSSSISQSTSQHYSELAAKNAELVAQNEAVRQACLDWENTETPNAWQLIFDEIKRCANAAPQQCLRDIQAEAVRDFILWGTANMDPEFAEFSDCAEEFISQGLPKTITSDDRIRRGEV